MVKTLHQMSGFDASAHPGPEFEEEQAWEATRQQAGVATQVMQDPTADVPRAQLQVGRRISDAQWELFVACEAAEALQQQFETMQPEFVVMHDIGTHSSRRMLQGLAAAMQRPVHQLHIRRQGVGMPLARLEFVELPVGADQPPLRLYTTEADADTAQRRRLARTLLSHSRLGVVMVSDLPPHALATALMPLRDAIVEGPWNNQELLMLPLSGASSLGGQAAHLARGSKVKIRTTPVVTRPAEAWSYLRASWNKLREQLSEEAIHIPEIFDLVPATTPARAPAAGAARSPRLGDARGSRQGAGQPDAGSLATAALGPAARRKRAAALAVSRRRASVHDAREDELIAFHVHRHDVLRPELAFQDQLGHRVLDALLDRALQWPRAEHRIEADLGQRRQCPR
jgi:hypothetical protein